MPPQQMNFKISFNIKITCKCELHSCLGDLILLTSFLMEIWLNWIFMSISSPICSAECLSVEFSGKAISSCSIKIEVR